MTTYHHQLLAAGQLDAYVALGQVADILPVNKFGANPTIATGTVPETFWFGGGLYPWQETSFTLEMVTSGQDSAAGTGAQSVRWEGLDDNWLYQSVDVATNAGTTAVPGTWRRVFGGRPLVCGSQLTNDQDITAQLTGGGDVQGVIEAGVASTRLGIYTIPDGEVALLRRFWAGITSAATGTDCVVALYTRENDIAGRPWIERELLPLAQAGKSRDEHEFETPLLLTAKQDIELRVISATNTIGIAGGFQLKRYVQPAA